jgi:hypothetical protein
VAHHHLNHANLYSIRLRASFGLVLHILIMAIVHKTASIADYALPIGSNLALTALISNDYDMSGKTARLRVVGSRKAFEISTEDAGSTLVITGQRIQTNSAPDDVATIGQPNEFLAVQKLGVCGWAIDIYDGDELDFRIQGQIEFFDSSGPIPGTFGEFPEIAVSVTPGDALPVTVQVSAGSEYVLPAPTTTTLGGVKRNTGNEGQFVTGIDTDGSLLRATPAGAGSGTVTSVAVSGSDGIEIDSGSPITTSGTIALGVNATTLKTHIALNNVENTAISTFAGSANITTIGTISTGTVPVANVSGLGTAATTDASAYAPALGVDDNYVTDAEKTVIGNTSGTNTGDNAVNSLYSGLVTNATHTGDVTGATALTIANGAVTEAKCNSSINASLDLADSSIQPGNAALTDERVPTAAGLTSKFGTNKATIVDGDKIAILDSAATDAPKHSLFSLIKSTLKTYFDTLYAATLGVDDNYVTDAEKTVIGNTSGTNTGDQDLSGYVLTTAIDTLAELNGIVTDATLIDTNDARLSDARTPTAHSHEGTAILSTGEVGGTKFLREDGDGTCSWQAIAGGGDALTSNPLSQFAATTSSQLAGVISDETGSGALVFATSPTLVTPALGTPASGTLTNCTGLPEAGLADDAVTLAKMASGTAGNLITYDESGNPAAVATGTATHVLTSNGAGLAPTFQAAAGGGGLTDITETLHTTAPNNTVNAVELEVTGGTTNTDLVLTPKGTGAFILGPEPDGTATGGNKRGARAVDLQTSRNAATKVASGAGSIQCGSNNTTTQADGATFGSGNNNTGSQGAVTLGSDNTNSTKQGFCVGGINSLTAIEYSQIIGYACSNSAYHSGTWGMFNAHSARNAYTLGTYGSGTRPGTFVFAGGRFGGTGDAQFAMPILRATTSDATPTELLLETSARFTIPASGIIAGTISLVGTRTDGSAVAHYLRQFCLKNVAGTTSEVYSPITIGTDNAAGTSIAITANDTNDALKIEVTGIAAQNWRWQAIVYANDIKYTS